MKINMNFGVNANGVLNIHRLNQNLARNNMRERKIDQNENKDNVKISLNGKANNIIESLMKQKQSIREQKDKLINDTLENGESLESIKTQLELYEEQLKNIDDQISKTISEKIAEQAEKQKNSGDLINNGEEAKTEEEIQNERLSNVTGNFQNLKYAETVSSVKTKIDGEARVLESEINLDKLRGMSGETIAKREDKLDKMKEKSSNLNKQISGTITETNDEINDEIKKEKSSQIVIVGKQEDEK